MATIDLTAPEVDLPKARELLHKALDLLERNDDAAPPSDARTLALGAGNSRPVRTSTSEPSENIASMAWSELLISALPSDILRHGGTIGRVRKC